jgi:hypothetical protein
MRESMRKNKTVANLQLLWQQLDDASGALYNATDTLARMVDLPDEIQTGLDRIDIGLIDGVKERIEIMIEEKQNQESSQ